MEEEVETWQIVLFSLVLATVAHATRNTPWISNGFIVLAVWAYFLGLRALHII
jgi:hypothetical protein